MPETLRDRRVRHARSLIMGADETGSSPGPLVGACGDLTGQRVLVLGDMVGKTLCALMHTECRRAEARLPGCSTEGRSADLVLVPHLTDENAAGIIGQAAHALCPRGRIRIALPVADRRLLASCTLLLIGAGFDLPELCGPGSQQTLCAARGEHPGRA